MSVIFYKYLENLQMWMWSEKGKCHRRPIFTKVFTRDLKWSVFISTVIVN